MGLQDMNNSYQDRKFVKVLMVAQLFPPAGGVGTFRIAKYVKYLRLYGWEPIVLTVREDYYPRDWCVDHTLVNDIPTGTIIHRTKLWDLHYFNDPGIRWIPFLLVEAIRIIHRERPALLYITADPFFPLIIGPIVKKICGIDYVVDLRDPWKLAYFHDNVNCRRLITAQIGHFLTRILEPFVIRNARKVICVSKNMCEEYRDEYNKVKTEKFTVITNGYDEDDYASVDPIRYEQFTIVYTGKFLAGEVFRDPSNFFCSLKILRDRGVDIKFIHVGKIEEKILEMLDSLGIRDLVKCIGQRSYRESIAFAKGADLLLLIGGGQKSEQTSKIFDYLGCKRPILALARKDGGIAEVVKNSLCAMLIENDEPKAIAAAIMVFYKNRGQAFDLKTDLSKYSRRNLTRMLTDIFAEIYDVKN
jgi:glycosyltransferase involved in cell wall biosynthesis